MRITDRYFSFPPHIVCCFDQICCIEGKKVAEELLSLKVFLINGHKVQLPDLEENVAKKLFDAYQRFHDNRQILRVHLRSISQAETKEELQANSSKQAESQDPFSSIFRPAPTLFSAEQLFGPSPFGPPMEQMARHLRHNPEMKDLPSLPKDILERIANAAQLLLSHPEDAKKAPEPEIGCQCVHCQIARAIQQGLEHGYEPVTNEDLRLSTWHIKPIEDSRYLVENTLDPSHCHLVALKPSISCSCGDQNCQHIEAVLRS